MCQECEKNNEVRPQIKFCGIRRIEDVVICNDLKPDYIGFVFFDKSKRFIKPIEAKALKEKLNKNVLAVGVFVNETIDNIVEIVNQGIIDLIQLHGEEDNEYIRQLKEKTKTPIMKAFKISDKSNIINVERCIADYVLLDSGAGTGTTFDWELIKNIKRNYFLAGGLDVNNVEEAIEKLKPFAVDVSSGIETGGTKDKIKMIEFINKVR